jgi:hypothetical protein
MLEGETRPCRGSFTNTIVDPTIAIVKCIMYSVPGQSY